MSRRIITEILKTFRKPMKILLQLHIVSPTLLPYLASNVYLILPVPIPDEEKK